MITRIPIQRLSSPTTHRTAVFLSEKLSNALNLPARPCLLSQRQCLRKYSTAAPPPPSEAPPKPTDLCSQLSSASPSTPSPPQQKRSLRPYIYATIFLVFGLTTGKYFSLIIAPPDLPPPGSKEDKLMVEFLRSQAEKLPIVQSLSTDPAWTSYDAYSALSPAELAARLTSGPLAGARALGGFQRVFYNKDSGEIVTVIWFGGAISGWPGVLHGGVTSTVMDEVLGRCAIKTFPAGTGVTANLEIDYLKPIQTNNYYVVRAVPLAEGRSERKVWVSGRMESVNGAVLVEAKGLFVVPKHIRTPVIAKNF